ncbi:MAG: FG-GAP-like repeat-containing protein [Ignavibacteriaceae bacterium]
MKTVKVLLAIVLLQVLIFPQSKTEYSEISPDGKLISTYKTGEILNGVVMRISDDIPFDSIPDWSSTLDRQIGGMAWADYDDDGDLDLATGCYFSNSFPPIPEHEVLIYRNDNGVLTTTPAWISSDMRSTTDIRFVDLDGDGRPELLAANGDQSFAPSVIYFNGPGGLETTAGWISADNVWTVGAAFGDIDGDGDLDLAFGNQGNTTTPTKPMSVFYNNGGTFSTTPNWLSGDQMITNSVAFGDLDNQELLTQVSEFTGDGTRYTFPLPLFPVYSIDSVLIDNQFYTQYCYDPISGWISLGTKPAAGINVRVVYKYVVKGDLAASKWVNYQSGVYFNNNGVLNNLPGWTVGNTQSQKGIAWADFDKDGYLDLAISGSSAQTVIYKNDHGVLTGPVWTSNSVSTSAQELITGDVDRDGYPELAVVHFGSRRVEIFKNRNGVLDTEPTWLYIAGSSATSISFGDLNGDGFLDLAVGTARAPVVVFINQSPPIPVELISLSASVNGNDITVNWSTGSEINNMGFEIQKKVNSLPAGQAGPQSTVGNEEWNIIGFVEGNGTTTGISNYSFVDKQLTAGIYNYRIKQLDFDGTFKYYNLVESVEVGLPSGFELSQNYPNPFNPSTTISWQTPGGSWQTLKVFDLLGREVATLVNEYRPAGSYEVEFDASRLPSGTYFYTISASGAADGFFQTRKMMLVK